MKDYYYFLGISETASGDQIKSAYRKLIQKYHPDKNGNDPYYFKLFSEVAHEGGYIASLGIGTGAGRSLIYYHPSGWSGSNQYVWKTFGIAKGATYGFFAAGLVTNGVMYYTRQQTGLTTSLNVVVSITSMVAGGSAGIAISGGYEYGKYMRDCITGYGQSVNQLYQQTFQNYLKGTLEDPSYQP
jgi:hypothetical protein